MLMQLLGVVVLQRGVWHRGPIGGYLGPIDGALTPLVAVLAGVPTLHLSGRLAARRAEVPRLSRCARAAGAKSVCSPRG